MASREGRMTRIRYAAALGIAILLAAGPAIAADEPDELMPGRIVLIRNGVIAKFVAKAAPALFNLPSASNYPTAEGATLSLFDTAGPEADSYNLPAGQWKGLGAPAGSKG